jgi:putative alpha-1,2-mannosidase
LPFISLASIHFLGAYFTYGIENLGANEQIGAIDFGISYISTKRACENRQREIDGRSPSDVQKEGEHEWNELMNMIVVEGKKTDKRIFYSSLYVHIYSSILIFFFFFLILTVVLCSLVSFLVFFSY